MRISVVILGGETFVATNVEVSRLEENAVYYTDGSWVRLKSSGHWEKHDGTQMTYLHVGPISSLSWTDRVVQIRLTRFRMWRRQLFAVTHVEL